MRLGEGAQAPDAPAEKFRDWQEHKLNLLGSPQRLRQQMEVWFF
jgi:hypothetical protein